MAEFLLTAPLLLLAALAALEGARWLHVRQMIDLALWQAARAGASQHADPAVMAQAFEQALLPLHARDTPQASAAWLARTLDRRTALLSQTHDAAPPWQIRILQPDASAYARFADPALPIARASGHPAINHDYQVEQYRRHPRQYPQPAQQPSSAAEHGMAQSPASAAKRFQPDLRYQSTNIFQANTLVLQLTYPHEPLVPGLNRLIAGLRGTRANYAQRALDAGLLPMTSEVRISMESHPVRWPSLADGRVVQADAADMTTAPRSGAACTGLWCQWRALPAPDDGSHGWPATPGASAPPAMADDPAAPGQPGAADAADDLTDGAPADDSAICLP